MLATLVDEPFSSDDWIFEAKLDGERCLVFRKGMQVRLVSRNRKLLNKTYPELVAPLAAQEPQHYIADGEITGRPGADEVPADWESVDRHLARFRSHS